MPEPEVIDLLGSDSDDDVVEVLHHNTAQPRRAGTEPTQHRRKQRRRDRQRHATGARTDDEDEVEVVGERVIPGGEAHVVRDDSLVAVLHVPNGIIVERGVRLPLFERERREREQRAREAELRRRQQEARWAAQRRGQLIRAGQQYVNDFFGLMQGARHHDLIGLNNNDEDYEDDHEDDPDYEPGVVLPDVRTVGMFEHRQFHHLVNVRNDNVPEDIMREIAAREEQEFDRMRNQNMEGSKGAREFVEAELAKIKAPYTSTIDPNEKYVCVLCGVVLGEGIAESFDPREVKRPLAALQEEFDCKAPYQAHPLLTTADKDLSRRIFISKCGHTYCGRCVNAVSSVTGRLKGKKVDKTNNEITNPWIYAPQKCVASDCDKKINGKKNFVEMFF